MLKVGGCSEKLQVEDHDVEARSVEREGVKVL